MHSGSVRGVSLSDDGQMLYSISADRSIKGINTTGALVVNYENAHKKAINQLFFLSPTEFATGDDDGVVKLWDVRTPHAVMEYELHEDFISSFAYNPDRSTLLSAAGDASLCAYDLRNQANTARSDEQESEIHCLQIIKDGKKILCGSQDGVLLVFSWDRWGDCSDRFPGHPDSIDSMLKIDEQTVLTGSGDGLIRVLSIQPNRVLGVIGDHENFPVEGMRLSYDRQVLVSFSHDEDIRFWDLSMLDDDAVDVEEKEIDDDGSGIAAVCATGDITESGDDEEDDDGTEENIEDGEGGDDSMSTGGDSDSDSDEPPTTGGGQRSASVGNGRRLLPNAQERFFADL